jgi:WD40 repeat protein
MQGKPRVFISYCRSDGTEFSTQLRHRLKKEHPEITLWQDVISERGGRDWWLQITEALDKVECMVLLLTPDAMKSATVRKEWRYARQKGVYVYPIQGSSKLDYMSLPRWIQDLHIDDISYDAERKNFTSAGAWQKFINTLNTPHETPRVPFMVEDLPENFVERPREFEELVALLRDEKREEPVAITAALQGAGGFGKTTLARALCHDERIQEAFDDGVLWTTLGEKPGDLTIKVVDLIEMLSGERPGFKEAEAASARLGELLAERDILMVIDDVWNAAHLRPFFNGGKRCARLITTRNLETLPAKAHPVNVDAMQQREAIKLLATGLSFAKEHAEELRGLSEKLGEWPLLLQLVNSVLRERVKQQKQPLDKALDYAQQALAKRGLTAFDARDPVAREQAVSKTLGVSLELLNHSERERYVELAIFPEDEDVPLTTLARLWSATGNLDEFDTEELCARLHGLSLLLTFDLTSRHIRLHDVMRKFLISSLANTSAVHGKLVDAWGDPHQLPDTYAWHSFAYHLTECEREGELRNLLLDFEWMRNKLEATDIAALIADYDYLTDHNTECEMVQGALQLSAHVVSGYQGKAQLATQLLGRLLGQDNAPGIRVILNQAAQTKEACLLRPLKASLIPPGGPLLRTLAGHSSWVKGVAITGDGAWAISASDDNTLKVWELKTGKLLHSLREHTGWVNAVAITADGAWVVSASSDCTLKVWELKTGKLLHSLEGHSNTVIAVAITPDGARAVSASGDSTLKVWELKTGTLLYSLESHRYWVTAVAITPDGARAVSASNDNTLKVWELKTGKLMHSLEGHSTSVNAVAITGDGAWGVSASDDNTLKVWELKTGKLMHSLEGHSTSVNAVAITGDGAWGVSASDDNTLKVWELKTGKLLHSLRGHSRAVNAVAITGDGARAVSASNDNTLKVWELKTAKLLHSLEDHSNWVNAVVITEDGARAVSAFNDHSLKVWDLKTGKLMHSLEGHSNSVMSVAITGDSARAVSASHDNTLKVWDLKTGKLLHSLQGHNRSVNAVAITEDGARAISASHDNTLKVWELKTGKLLHSLDGHINWINAVAITGDGARAVSASSDHSLKVWELKTGKLLHSLEGHNYRVSTVAITPDGARAVSASWDNTLKVWDLKTGKLLHSLRGHRDSVNAVAITADGARAVSASRDNTLKVWDLKTGKLLHSLEGHSSPVNAMAITADGARAVSASDDKTLKVWDLKTGKMLATFSAEAPIYACAVASDGITVVGGDALGRVHFLRMGS